MFLDRPPFNKIDEMLYLGSMIGTSNSHHLSTHNISVVVQALPSRLFNPHLNHISYHNVPVEDSPSQNILQYLPEAIAFVFAAHQARKNVLIHCAAGISRSSTVACAYLMVKYDITFDEALSRVKKYRPIASPNIGFSRQLRALPVKEIRASLNLI